ncbi:lipid A deacylase LpxR family protein [Microbulbifer halophilus]|uniref:Lipid A deacylase LpxR family protein n=1 Tax=Microbulbifer halophilus TaxID=453963 RepID=A0ABW5EBZ0_9GAMM|nr:lipid A deacylase LpxR family protein [Microbulbifer halophilus]MCW8126191.1 lipid A deacylase LpxR family protein [Microbulbifer halophilus]
MQSSFSASKNSSPDNAFARRKASRTLIGLLLLGITCFVALSVSDAKADSAEPDSSLQAVTLRIDNDLFAGSDRGYSNGVEVGFLSQTVDHFRDRRLSAGYRLLNRATTWLQPRGFSAYNMAVSVGHGIFTPGDWRQEELVEDDRPYAGLLVFGADYNGRRGNRMRTTGIDLGIVGPSAQAEPLQKAVHSLAGSERFRGWDNQLSDEVVFRIRSQWLRRYRLSPSPRENWQSDLILHGGGSIGNLETSANAGVEWRFGPQLPDNFGSAPLLPVALNSAPQRSRGYSPKWQVHGFVIADLRLVAHRITFEGNTWKDSHSVDRKPFVADLGLGIAATYGKWQLAFARYLRSRKFSGQSKLPQLGSLTVRRNF